MKKTSCKAIVALFLSMVVSAAVAQQGRIVGKVFSTGRESLGGATILLQTPKDSITRQTVLTDSTGKFVFSHVPMGSYRVHVTALNYQDVNRLVRITPGKEIGPRDSVLMARSFH